MAAGDCIQRRSLVVDDDGLFIPDPAIVKIIEDNWPMNRRFRFSLVRTRVLLPQPPMAEDAFYHVDFMNQADDFHLMAAAGTTQRVDFPDLLVNSLQVLERTRWGI